VEIRPEQTSDFEQVYAVNSAAFGGEGESKLVEKLRQVQGYISFVAVENEQVIGHISFLPLTLDGRSTFFSGLAPMSVLPGRQKQGIGSALIATGLDACRSAGYTAVFVLGHSGYYPRFGFRTAADLGFTCEYPVPPDHFMVIELVENSLAESSGLIKYDDAFAGL